MDRGACRLQSMGSQRVEHDLVTEQHQQPRSIIIEPCGHSIFIFLFAFHINFHINHFLSDSLLLFFFLLFTYFIFIFKLYNIVLVFEEGLKT